MSLRQKQPLPITLSDWPSMNVGRIFFYCQQNIYLTLRPPWPSISRPSYQQSLLDTLEINDENSIFAPQYSSYINHNKFIKPTNVDKQFDNVFADESGKYANKIWIGNMPGEGRRSRSFQGDLTDITGELWSGCRRFGIEYDQNSLGVSLYLSSLALILYFSSVTDLSPQSARPSTPPILVRHIWSMDPHR